MQLNFGSTCGESMKLLTFGKMEGGGHLDQLKENTPLGEVTRWMSLLTASYWHICQIRDLGTTSPMKYAPTSDVLFALSDLYIHTYK